MWHYTDVIIVIIICLNNEIEKLNSYVLFASIKAGKLLPYQDYLLYKPSGSLRTKAFFQQKSDSIVGINSCDATLDEESGLTVENCEVSRVQTTTTDVSADFDNSTEYCTESALQDTPHTVPSDQDIPLSDLPDEAASVTAGEQQLPLSSHLSADSAVEVSKMSTSLVDNEQMSAENRKRVSEFFSHSRLHHISMWGAEYKSYVTQLQSQVTHSIVMCYSFSFYLSLAFEKVLFRVLLLPK